MKRILLKTILLVFALFTMGQANAQIIQGFEGSWTPSPSTSYANYTIDGWQVIDGLREATVANVRSGSYAVRLDQSPVSGQAIISPEVANGINTVSFWYRHWDGDANGLTYKLFKSANGTDWTEVGDVCSGFNSTTYTAYSVTINDPAVKYVKVEHISGGERMIFDDFEITEVGGVNATLSDLKVDGTTVAGFAPAVLFYLVNLPANTVTVPAVTATAADASATIAITPAADLSGEKEARTTTVLVTGSDGITKKTYSVQFDPLLEVNNLAALRAATDLTRIYKLTSEAVLTAKMAYRNKKFVQDATAAILIDDLAGKITTIYDVGDGISGLKGTLELYNGTLQFHPTEDPGAKTSTGNVITPQTLTITEFKANLDQYESELIKFEDVTFPEASVGGLFTNGTNYVITNGGVTTIMRTEFYDVFTSITIPAIANITGIALDNNGTAQIAPRVVSDIGTATEINPAISDGIRMYPVPVAVLLTIEGVDSFTGIEIRDITGKMVYSTRNSGASVLTVDTSSLPKGVYFLRLTSPAGSVTKRFIRN